MKIMTLNVHAWMETDQLRKIEDLADYIREQQFDAIALQEVNQSKGEEALSAAALDCFVQAEPETVIRRDNYAYVLLQKLGIPYYWTWIPVHTGFVKYDEGLAILSRTPITSAFSEYVSVVRDYENYRTRKIVGVKAEARGEESWFVSGHFGWWNDDVEPFRGQWDAAQTKLDSLKEYPVFIMGDFNNVAEIRDEGYDYVVEKGWHDLYASAYVKDDGATVTKAIKGWDDNKSKLRIDYIFSNRQLQAKSCHVVMNGIRGAVVSDHFGVAVEL
ncbi:endonuclease/exonuclease/phosphatase family protein [Paenibacillus sophorae]|uniref:Endonuclease/exonuclease/phosphatase family protein n=2 Tax=Paenibacillus sophorae TaxID=1333845 RepID=A0ABX8H6T7_9BACL|nr:endonuclease/exonuclease/phosphatase family protein [Paenibacillus sophorae]QWU13688.1 endonuclease/exonuclease/phosphatase family protein [Paenibacillus sophorae]